MASFTPLCSVLVILWSCNTVVGEPYCFYDLKSSCGSFMESYYGTAVCCTAVTRLTITDNQCLCQVLGSEFAGNNNGYRLFLSGCGLTVDPCGGGGKTGKRSSAFHEKSLWSSGIVLLAAFTSFVLVLYG